MAAVTTGGTALGNELFAAEGHAAVAAVAGLDADSCFVNKHFSIFSVRRGYTVAIHTILKARDPAWGLAGHDVPCSGRLVRFNVLGPGDADDQ